MGKLTLVIFINALIILLFLLSNYSIWSMVNSNPHLGHTLINPIAVSSVAAGDYVNGTFHVISGSTLMPNLPFWLFFLAIGVNMLFIIMLKRDNRNDPPH